MRLPFQQLFDNPQLFVRDLLLFIPGFVIALVLHELAHAYVALRCGDPTAKMMGRVTLNPLKHLDPLGTFMLVFAGIGWAKPVPVNPRNFKKPRRDDNLVSIAGIGTNLALFLLFTAIMYAFLFIALSRSGLEIYLGEKVIMIDTRSYFPASLAFAFPFATEIAEAVISPQLGVAMSLLYQIIAKAALINFTLALFNLLPMPPLDGSHLFSNLFFNRQDLFASPSAARAGQVVVLLLLFTGWFSQAMNFLLTGTFGFFGRAAATISQAMGL